MSLRSLLFVVSFALAAGQSSSGWPQVSSQEQIDRNLQERAARERELTMRLDAPLAPPAPLPPAEVKRSVLLRTPGTEVLEPGRPLQPAPRPVVIPASPPVVTGTTLLDDSQRRRQEALETENQRLPLDDPARQRATQIQELNFDRETRSQELGSTIMRESQRALEGR